MNEFVVGVDGSDHSRMALRWAAATASAAGVPVRAVQSWTMPTHPGTALMPVAPVLLSPVEVDEMHHLTQQAITAAVTDTLGASTRVTTAALRVRAAGAPSRPSLPTARSCWVHADAAALPDSSSAR